MNRIVFILLSLLSFNTTCAIELEELLSRQAEALGGLSRLVAVKSCIIRSDLDAGGMKGTSVSYFKVPDKFRVDMSLPIMSFSQACVGQECWVRDSRGLTHSSGAELKGIMISQGALGAWAYLDRTGFNGKITVADTNYVVEQNPCYLLQLSPRGGVIASLAVDKETFLPRQVAMTTDRGTVTTELEEYRAIDGIMIPFRSTESSEAGLVSCVSTVTSVEFDTPLGDSLFRPVTRVEKLDYLPEGTDSIVVPFDLWRNHIYVQLLINGKGPFDFIFDTGAGGVGISRKLLAALPLKRLGATEARGVGGADISEVYRIDSLSLAEIKLGDVFGYAVDFGFIEKSGRRNIDGVIGYELLSRFLVTVDYESHNLVFYRRETEPRQAWGTRCPLTIDFSLPYIDAVVNDSISGRFRLDTGSHSSIDFNSPFVRAHKLVKEDSGHYRPVTAFGIGGASSGLVGLLPSIELCGTGIESVYVNFSTAESGIFAGPNTAGNIGAGILKGFTITFDYNREAVYFRESARLEELRRTRNMAGVGIKKIGEDFVVTIVFPGKGAYGALQEGDLLEMIGGAGLKGRSEDEVNQMLIRESGAEIEVIIRRDGQPIRRKVVLDALY